MFKSKLARNLATGMLFAAAAASTAAAQKEKEGTPSQDPSSKARNVKPELKEAYK